MNDDRGPWYLLTGLVIGVALGLFYAWRVAPVEYKDTHPSMLRAEYKDQYRILVASAYAANGDLARAQARLKNLADPDISRTLTIQAQRALAGGSTPEEAHALGLLAVALSQGGSPGVSAIQTAPVPPDTALPVASPSFTPAATLEPATSTPESIPAPSLTPTAPASATPTQSNAEPTITPLPTRTATPTPGAPYVLQSKTPLCDEQIEQPLIMIEANDAAGQPVPGVDVFVSWQGGQDHFFTGLKRELGLGYADFVMTPGESYTVHLADGGEPVPDLIANECAAADGDRFWGSWRLVFIQP